MVYSVYKFLLYEYNKHFAPKLLCTYENSGTVYNTILNQFLSIKLVKKNANVIALDGAKNTN